MKGNAFNNNVSNLWVQLCAQFCKWYTTFDPNAIQHQSLVSLIEREKEAGKEMSCLSFSHDSVLQQKEKLFRTNIKKRK